MASLTGTLHVERGGAVLELDGTAAQKAAAIRELNNQREELLKLQGAVDSGHGESGTEFGGAGSAYKTARAPGAGLGSYP